MTGVGAVFNAAKVEPGSTVAVIGCGGVGLSAVNGAALAGAERIIAIDTVASKLELARELGATDTLNASNADPVEQVREHDRRRRALLVRGARHQDHRRAGFRHAAPGRHRDDHRHGAASGRRSSSTATTFCATANCRAPRWAATASGSTCRGCCRCGARVGLKLDHLISGRLKLEQINEGFAALKSGAPVRQLIDYGAA